MYCLGIGYVLAFFIYHINQIINNKKLYGKGWDKSRSRYFRPNGSLNWFNILGIITRAGLAFLGTILIYLTFQYSVLAGIISSIVISILSGTAFFTSLAFYLIYREMLTIRHLVGMILLIGGIFVIAFGSGDTSSPTDTSNNPT